MRRLPAWMLVASALACEACTLEDVVTVEASDVAVVPASASALEGERFRLQATVQDEGGQPLPGAVVAWSSSDPFVAAVDADGWVRAVGAGSVEVTATYHEATGSATVRVLRGPSISVSHGAVELRGVESTQGADTVRVFVTNAGAGTLDGLGVTVAYDVRAPTAWLVAQLVSASAPTSLQLAASAAQMPAGTYRATLSVAAPGVSNSPVAIPVTFLVSAAPPPPPPPPPPRIAFVESGGGTFVTEGGTSDTVMVALAAAPTSNVVIQVRSGDSGEVSVQPPTLHFTPANWAEPQAVIATGVDEPFFPDFDGDQVVTLTLSVVDGSSDPTYHGLSATVRVTNVDNDDFLPGG